MLQDVAHSAKLLVPRYPRNIFRPKFRPHSRWIGQVEGCVRHLQQCPPSPGESDLIAQPNSLDQDMIFKNQKVGLKEVMPRYLAK